MKKILSILLVAIMLFAIVGCSQKDNVTDPTVNNTDNATNETTPSEDIAVDGDADDDFDDEDIVLTETETMLSTLAENRPMQFMCMTFAVDKTDAEMVKAFTGLDSVNDVEEIAVTEPMMSSQAFSVVLVKVSDGADVNAIANSMKDGINPAKWICVEADDVKTTTNGNYALLVMMSTEYAETATAKDMIDSFNDMFEIVAE